ncbi:cornifelin homolog B-like [Paramormyrops kingsleyae]|uniref:Plac8 onzin related protein 2 n=1 Tax=Paramormyrops kingsleyae TaxID=1676925 RepID=A0A3B3Q993_9TELE|nr:cornifelin homolog B-like [Paramormyrops kingsleyae]XP_023685039.1 cornifelin homolog B-like [Paramormyrops kingsleyae]XP_023685040.1 cornifelin homolog B-like [Paramormyrops kingsleyae]XP_023685041.1 cornifelin homolog B-like [Paramormyrops kingsleyae]XP_023685042.1 cornifelin homolog B-like [Paramormyrops kingsleyae]XP_023685043.1 cornifelin homolog B-like [Paramormyrops kingsleyae]
MATKIVFEQPQPAMERFDSPDWSSGICDCCQDKADCCFAFWCLPCYACRTSRAHGECLCLPLLDVCGIVPPITYAMRVSVRRHYGIRDTMCNDCLYATFCGPCTWCQISREMKARFRPITLINARVKE